MLSTRLKTLYKAAKILGLSRELLSKPIEKARGKALVQLIDCMADGEFDKAEAVVHDFTELIKPRGGIAPAKKLYNELRYLD